MEKNIPVRLEIHPIGLDPVKVNEYESLERAIVEIKFHIPIRYIFIL